MEEVVATVVREAEDQSDRELVRMWFALLFWDFQLSGADLEKFEENPAVLEVRSAARRLRVLDMPMDYGACRFPSEEDMTADEAVRWWFTL